MTTEEIIDAILSGQQDAGLAEIREAIDDRNGIQRTVNTRDKIRSMRIGDRVRFNSHARPQYLYGHEAKIVKVNKTRVVIVLDEHNFDRFSGQVTCPVDIIDKIEAQVAA